MVHEHFEGVSNAVSPMRSDRKQMLSGPHYAIPL
ncbi:hypothetical protein CH06BL_42760 [Chromobacterium haemolyticum]|nr:hypothetical protein CH06BL_42760 [Chromobacterium haemolyticum]